MRVQFKEFEKMFEYLRKNSDKGGFDVRFDQHNDSLVVTFDSVVSGDTVSIELFDDERKFSKVYKTERL